MARGHFPSSFEGRSVQAPGMMRHGPFPGLGPAAGHRSSEHPTEPLENKMVSQAAEMERYTGENQRLAATHRALREELIATQQEMQRLHAHIGSIHTESDIQIRVLLEKIAKMEADIRVGESIKNDLLQAHKEAKSLVVARKELSFQIQETAQELQKAHSEVKNLPELFAELNSLRQEHQRLRGTFEHEKGLNTERVEQMRAMEKNLMSMAREVEKLRAEVANAERRASASNLYGGTPPASNPYGGTLPASNPYGGTLPPPPPNPYGGTQAASHPYGGTPPPPPPNPYGATPPPPPPNPYAATPPPPPPPNTYGSTPPPPPPNPYAATPPPPPPPPPNPYGATPPPPPPNPYGVTGTYGNPDPSAPPAQGASVYLDAYGRPYPQMSNGISGDGSNLYASGNGTASAVLISEGTGG